MSAVLFFPMLILVGLAILVILIFSVSRRNPPIEPHIHSELPGTSRPPETRNQRREEILTQLANRQITREEAEQQLIDLDTPLPEHMPPAPPAPGRSGCGTGCLIVLLCLLALPLLLLFLRIFGVLLIHV